MRLRFMVQHAIEYLKPVLHKSAATQSRAGMTLSIDNSVIDRFGKLLQCTWSWFSGRHHDVVRGQDLLGIVLTINHMAQWCKGAMILCTMGLLQFCHQGGPLCSVLWLKNLWKKARSPLWSALHSSACWAPIASICGMSALRRSHIPETSCFPAAMI